MKRGVIIICIFFVSIIAFPQVYVPGTHNDWDLDSENQATLKSNLGTTDYYGINIQPAFDDVFKIVLNDWGTTWGGGYWINDYNRTWNIGYAGDDAIWKGTFDNYVHICIEKPSDYVSQNIPTCIMTLSADPITISSTSQVGSDYQQGAIYYAPTGDQTVNITLSAAKSSEEKIYVRYTTDSWSSDNFVLAEEGGIETSYSATIPSQAAGTTVDYYVLTTTLAYSVEGDLDTYPDLCTINYDNNSGSNYSYTVSGPRSDANGNWSSTGSWLFGAVPLSSEDVTIVNDITIDTDAECASLTVNSGSAVDINAGQSLTVSGAFTNNGSFTINSDATGTGSLIINGASSGSGTFTMQRYIANNNSWHLLSAPVSDELILTSDFVVTNVIMPTNYDFYSFDESASDKPWINIRTESNLVNPLFDGLNFGTGKGYLVAYDPSYGNTAFEFSGSINTGDIETATLTYSNQSGANLIGNPYSSSIDWSLADKSMFSDNYAYVYNENKSGGAGYEEVTNDIGPNQGFFVLLNSGNTGQTFTFTNSIQSHGGSFLKSDIFEDVIKVRLSGEMYFDETSIVLNQESNNERDRNDAAKFFSMNSSVPQVYTKINNNFNAAINSFSELSDGLSIPLSIYVPKDGTYDISLTELTGSLNNQNVYLYDKETNSEYLLNDIDEYSFAASTDDDPNRFQIHFSPVGINETADVNTLQVYSTTGNINIINNLNLTGEVKVVNIMGQTISTAALNGNTQQSITMDAPTGVYIVNINTVDGSSVSHKVIINQ